MLFFRHLGGICGDRLMDVSDGATDFSVEVVVDVAVQGGVGAGAGHSQQVAGHVGDHQ